jgi:hypothetical protein
MGLWASVCLYVCVCVCVCVCVGGGARARMHACVYGFQIHGDP